MEVGTEYNEATREKGDTGKNGSSVENEDKNPVKNIGLVDNGDIGGKGDTGRTLWRLCKYRREWRHRK
jgi:hypothetical protein